LPGCAGLASLLGHDSALASAGYHASAVRLAQAAAFGRRWQPPEIAEVVAFLASAVANWIPGQNILVNGGIA